MPALLIKDIPREVHEWLKREAENNRRSMTQQAILILEERMRRFRPVSFPPVLLMTPKRLQRASLASEVEREMKREGLTLEDLLKDLKGQRKRYLAETYPKD